jgi:hypothetical protein
MQPKFTLRKNYGLFGKLATAVVTLALCTQFTYAQEGRSQSNTGSRVAPHNAERIQAKLRGLRQSVPVSADNDAGKPNRVVTGATMPSADAICATFTGSLAAGDLTMPNRLTRPGAAFGSTCAVPSTFPGPFAIAGGVFYDVHTFTNTSGLTQCGTFTLTTTDLTNANIAHAVYDGSFDPNNLATNYMADPGVSTGTPQTAPLTFGRTINAGQTIVIVVMSANSSTGAAGTASDYTLTVDFPICASAPCSGTPAPGNTISSVPTVCPTINFQLSLQNSTPGSGVSYQWERSPDGSTWTAFGTNSPVQTVSQTTMMYYRATVTCGANSGTSTPVQVLLTPASGCYCIPPSSDCTDSDVIERVRISTLDNASACSPSGYGNYTGGVVAAPTIYRGAANTIIVNVPTVWPETVTAWIDYNQNGAFEASEYTVIGNNNAGGQITNVINIPGSALTGTTRMRVRVQFAATTPPTGACTGFTFGETEDYDVNIQPCVPISITGQPTSVTTQCSGNASFTVTTNGSLPSYSWQYRVNSSSSWQTVTAGGVYGSNVNSNTLTLSSIPSSMNGYQFRALVSGGCSAVDFSNAATLTVGPLVATVTPTSATICEGSSQSISLTNVSLPVQVINEGFNTVSPLPTGWASQNNSTPVGTTGWFQGNTAVFPAQSGPPDSYIGANFNNVAGANTISNWLMTPEVTIKNNDVLTFWTRTVGAPAFPDRLEVRMSSAGSSTNVGATNTSVGDFTTLLTTVNPSLTTAGYPTSWTQFTITISGLPAPVSGRFAFRYFVTNGGPAGANSDFIGIDNVVYTAGGVTQGTWTSNPASPNTMFTDPGLTTPYVTGTPVQTIYVNPVNTTTYSVVYSTVSPACTSNPTNVTVNVVKPATNVVAPTNKSVCVGGSTTFSASATGGPFTWVWEVSSDGGATWSTVSGATSPTLSVNNITQTMNNYRYRARISAPPCAGSVTTAAGILTVNPLPVVTASTTTTSITPGQTATLSVTSSPAPGSPANYQWFYNGNPVPGGTSSSLVVGIDELGEYTVELTDVNGCENMSNTLTIGGTETDKLWIYPNPSEGQFQVRLFYDGPYTDIRWIHIFDSKGRLVMKKAFDLYPTQPPYMQMSFDMSAFPAGTYVVKVEEKYTGKTKSGLLILH